MEYFLRRARLLLLETRASGTRGCPRVPAVSQGTENGMESGPSGPAPGFAPLCSHLHSNAPIRKQQGTKAGTEPGHRETLITKPFVWASGWKNTPLTRVLLWAGSCGNLPRSPLGTQRPELLLLLLLSPARSSCLGKGHPRVWAQVPGGAWHSYCTQETPTIIPITPPC